MPRISEMVPSSFCKKEDVENGALVTIQAVTQHNVAMANQPQELKWCLEFKENMKPLVLNVTNMGLLEEITGSDNSDDWIGTQIVLYNDKSVMYAGKRTGGVRLRAPRKPQAASRQAPAQRQAPPDAQDYAANETTAAGGNQIPDDEIPF